MLCFDLCQWWPSAGSLPRYHTNKGIKYDNVHSGGWKKTNGNDRFLAHQSSVLNYIGWLGSSVSIASSLSVSHKKCWSAGNQLFALDVVQRSDCVNWVGLLWCQVTVGLWNGTTVNWPRRVAILGYGSGNKNKGWKDRTRDGRTRDHAGKWHCLIYDLFLHSSDLSLVAGSSLWGGPDHRKDVFSPAEPYEGGVGAQASY